MNLNTNTKLRQYANGSIHQWYVQFICVLLIRLNTKGKINKYKKYFKTNLFALTNASGDCAISIYLTRLKLLYNCYPRGSDLRMPIIGSG